MTSAPRAPRPVLVTRPAGRGAVLLARLREAGIAAEHHPLLRLVPADEETLAAVRSLVTAGRCTHLVVTSRTVADVLGAMVVPDGTTVVAVGGGTAQALRAVGIVPDLVAAGTGAALVQEMPPAPDGATVLFPASSAASRTVPEGLRAKGYVVHEMSIYRPEPVEPPAAVAVGLAGGGYGALVLTSPKIARRAAAHGVHPSTPIVSIGDPTSAAMREAGLPLAAQAAEPTDEALVRAVQQVLAGAARHSPGRCPDRSPSPSSPSPSSPSPSSTSPKES